MGSRITRFDNIISRSLWIMVAFEHLAVSGFEKYGSCPSSAYPFVFESLHKCKSDIECGGHRKCCETWVGNYCMLPRTLGAMLICPDGEVSVGSCGNNLQCPPSYQCLHDICCRFEEKSGECPLLVIPEHFYVEHTDSCENDYECTGSRKCCPTLLGLRCLLPTAESAGSNSRYSQLARKVTYQPFYEKSTVIHGKDLSDSNFAYTRGRKSYVESTDYYDDYSQEGNE